MIRASGKPRGGRVGSLTAAVSIIRTKFSTMIQFRLTKSGLTFHLLNSFHSCSTPEELGLGRSHGHSCLGNIKTTNQKKNVPSRALEKIIKSPRT